MHVDKIGMDVRDLIVWEVGLKHPVQLEEVLGNLLEIIFAEVENGVQFLEFAKAKGDGLEFIAIQVEVNQILALADRATQKIELVVTEVEVLQILTDFHAAGKFIKFIFFQVDEFQSGIGKAPWRQCGELVGVKLNFL